MPLPQGVLANHAWHLVRREGKQLLILSCLIFPSCLLLASPQFWAVLRATSVLWRRLETCEVSWGFSAAGKMHPSPQQYLPHFHAHTRVYWNTHLLTVPVSPRCCYAWSSIARRITITQTCRFLGGPSVVHTNIFSSDRLAALSVSVRLAHTGSLTHTHTVIPPPFTYCLDRERSFYQQGYFTLRLWLIREEVEVEDEAVEEEEEEAEGMRWGRWTVLITL